MNIFSITRLGDFRAFSLIELMISLIAISLITAAFTPLVTKHLSSNEFTIGSSSGMGAYGVSYECKKDYNFKNDCCSVCSSSTKCNQCDKECSNCNSNQYLDQYLCECKSCTSIDENCIGTCNWSKSDGAYCTKCREGYYIENKKCRICPKGSYCDGILQYQCKEGTYSNEEGKSSCDTCPEGTYSTLGSTSCTKCTSDGNCSTCNSINTCSKCKAGYYLQNTSTCTTCPIGYYCTGTNTKTQCSAGTYRLIQGGKTQSDCTTCQAGFYCLGGNSRTSCLKGYYCLEGTNSSTQYPCTAGKYRNAAGGTQLSSCSDCSAGTYSKGGQSLCTNCPSGTYQSSTGKTSCDTCTKGHYCPEGSSTPQSCSAGTYRNEEGGKSQGDCSTCPAGQYSTSGAASCSSCTNNCSICATTSKCDTCIQGYYINTSSTCTQCEKGYSCSSGKTRSSCDAGKYQDEAGKTSCKTCASATGTANTICGCNKGHYLNNGTCTACPTGHYQSSDGYTGTSCTSCGSGITSCNSQTGAATGCNKGHYKNGNSCTSCPALHYQSEDSYTGASCTLCSGSHVCDCSSTTGAITRHALASSVCISTLHKCICCGGSEYAALSTCTYKSQYNCGFSSSQASSYCATYKKCSSFRVTYSCP